MSSTFRDMQEERNHLRDHVFPRLEEKLRERYHNLEPIDLRIGIETADISDEKSREMLVLKVCLEEIRRSRPFLMILLGDRYGWIPPPERIEAAAKEAGFATEAAGRSVTSLEIEFGLLKVPGQSCRSRIYFREPLPYERMTAELAARYSDQHASDPQTRAGYLELQALKAKLEGDPGLSPRIHRYTATWDETEGKVKGLDAWGNMVFENLWADLDEETRNFASEAPKSWQEREQAALVELRNRHHRDFAGRDELLVELSEWALGPTGTDTPWGRLVVGPPGSGKSALLAEFYQRLQGQEGVLVLMNAAGATAHGASADSMLERFTAELAVATGSVNPLSDSLRPEEIANSFANLLDVAACDLRVVMLLDALDQFESLPRSQELTWLDPARFSGNVRVLASALPGCLPARTFADFPKSKVLEIPRLNPTEIRAIAARVWSRYHRQINRPVLRVLEEKMSPDGETAAGLPLWIILALEQINLLDPYETNASPADPKLSPGEHLRMLLVESAARMPPEVPALYRWLLDQAEHNHGLEEARAFAVALALSRFGWHESDLRQLVPRVARLLFPEQEFAEPDDLKLANLRRAFRAHLGRHGPNSQLNFTHGQMRLAVMASISSDPALLRTLHAAIAGHLLSLPATDALRQSEVMTHLIAADDRERAAGVCADVAVAAKLTKDDSIIQALVLHIQSDPSGQALDWVCSLPAIPGLSSFRRWTIATTFNFPLAEALARVEPIGLQLLIQKAVQRGLEIGLMEDPTNELLLHEQIGSLLKLGDLALVAGDPDGFIAANDRRQSLLKSALSKAPDHAILLRELSLTTERRATFHAGSGDTSRARELFGESLALRRHLADLPINAPEWTIFFKRQLDMASLETGTPHEFSDDHPALARTIRSLTRNDLIETLRNLGDLAFFAEGDVQQAQPLYEEAFRIAKELSHENPGFQPSLFALALLNERLGHLMAARRRIGEAMMFHSARLEVMRQLLDLDPADPARRRDLTLALIAVGDVEMTEPDWTASQRLYAEALQNARELSLVDPSNLLWRMDLEMVLQRCFNHAMARRDFSEARRFVDQELAINQEVAGKDPRSPRPRRDLAMTYRQMADVLAATGNFTKAGEMARKSRELGRLLVKEFPGNVEFLALADATDWAELRVLCHRPLFRFAMMACAACLAGAAFFLASIRVWLWPVSVLLLLLIIVPAFLLFIRDAERNLWLKRNGPWIDALSKRMIRRWRIKR